MAGNRQRFRDFEPATYEIRVAGVLGANWSERLGGMRIALVSQEAKVSSLLEGELRDQAALLGVLNSLYDLGLPLLEVRCLSHRTPP